MITLLRAEARAKPIERITHARTMDASVYEDARCLASFHLCDKLERRGWPEGAKGAKRRGRRLQGYGQTRQDGLSGNIDFSPIYPDGDRALNLCANHFECDAMAFFMSDLFPLLRHWQLMSRCRAKDGRCRVAVVRQTMEQCSCRAARCGRNEGAGLFRHATNGQEAGVSREFLLRSQYGTEILGNSANERML